MTRAQAHKLLNHFEECGVISGHDLIDDGEGQPEGERYWGNIYLDGWSHGGAMSDDATEVKVGLVCEACIALLEARGYTVTEPGGGQQT
jgi:hypothetical protein